MVRDPLREAWTWEMSSKEDLVRWLGPLQWTAQGQVTFVELALDFEAASQQTLPAAPASKLCA